MAWSLLRYCTASLRADFCRVLSEGDVLDDDTCTIHVQVVRACTLTQPSDSAYVLQTLR